MVSVCKVGQACSITLGRMELLLFSKVALFEFYSDGLSTHLSVAPKSIVVCRFYFDWLLIQLVVDLAPE